VVRFVFLGRNLSLDEQKGLKGFVNLSARKR
jgi:hypothetical protein